jgi:hypothetical protein
MQSQQSIISGSKKYAFEAGNAAMKLIMSDKKYQRL